MTNRIAVLLIVVEGVEVMGRLTLRQILIAIALGTLFAALQGESPLRSVSMAGATCSDQPSGC